MHPLYEKYRKSKEDWEEFVSSTTVSVIHSIPDVVADSITVTNNGDAVADLTSGRTVVYRVLPEVVLGAEDEQNY